MNTINTTKEVKEFCERVGITPTQFTGEDPINGNLIIADDVTIPSSFKPRVTGYMNLSWVTTIPTGFAPVVGGSLYLEQVTEVGDGFAPLVGGSLYLNQVTIIGDGFAPIVGKTLFLTRATIIPAGFSPVVGGPLLLNSVTTIPAGFAPIVGGYVYLDSVTHLPADFAPIVGGTLYLDSVAAIPEGFTLIVGGSLWIPNATIPADFDPTAGSEVYFDDEKAEVKKLDMTKPIEARDGKYIIADKILTEVVSKRGNVWHVKCIGSNKVFYLVTDGSGNFAHGDTLKEARESLMYKISDRDMSKYERLSEDSELTFADAIKMYRTITGACAAGTRHFVESNKIEKKNYTIREIIDLTEGQYGHGQLVKFFMS